MEGKITIKNKAPGGKLCDAENIWYNVETTIIPQLDKINKGDEVSIVYTKKGVSRTISKITKATVEVPKVETPKVTTPTDPTKPHCKDCGKELKDSKYETCFDCSKKKNPELGTGSYHSENPEKTAQIQRGNALNAAAAVSSGQQFIHPETGAIDPEKAAQFTINLAQRFLTWLQLK
jgi:hypothetical protein